MLPALLVLTLLLTWLMVGCATPYDQEKSFWNGQTGFSQTRLARDRWQLEFVGNDLVDRETARKYVLKRAGELAVQQGYPWLQIDELTIRRDVVRVTPVPPLFGFDDDDDDEPDPLLAVRQVQHSISALLVFRLLPGAVNDHSLSSDELAKIALTVD